MVHSLLLLARGVHLCLRQEFLRPPEPELESLCGCRSCAGRFLDQCGLSCTHSELRLTKKNAGGEKRWKS
ncbi:hypothetical protein EK904_015106 [Melospiza melodia maxima]|nr:hypothetical protein EK904_015106 [Melospiza melodia maxima]